MGETLPGQYAPATVDAKDAGKRCSHCAHAVPLPGNEARGRCGLAVAAMGKTKPMEKPAPADQGVPARKPATLAKPFDLGDAWGCVRWEAKP